MSLAYAPRITRSTWVSPDRSTNTSSRPTIRTRRSHAAHRAETPARVMLPNTAVTSVAAVVLGLSLAATELPATVSTERPAEPSTDTGQIAVIPKALPLTAVASFNDVNLAKQATQTFRMQEAAHMADLAEKAAKAALAEKAAKAVLAKKAAKAAAAKHKAAEAKKKAARFKRTAHHKAARIGTNAYFGQFSETGNQRKHNAALIIEIGRKRGFSNHSIAIAVATSIQESGLRNLDWGDRDSLGLFQQRPSVKAWGTARQILNPTHAINRFYDALAGVRGRDAMPMKLAAMKVQIPDPFYYNRDWQWDRIAKQIVASYHK